jgi:uncharacterized protein (DUF1684 family)
MNRVRVACFTLLFFAHLSHAANDAYIAEIEKWRQDFDVDVRKDGWLTGVGNFEIPPGTSTLGSGRDSTMRLPAVHSPESIGKLVRRGDVVTFIASRGIQATLDGHPLSKPTILSMKTGVGRVQVGSIKFRVRPFADAVYLFVEDMENPDIAAFAGSEWFPIDDAYRVTATFVPYEAPAETRVPLTHIEWTRPMTSTGDVVFTLADQKVRLKTFTDEEGLFIMFSDLTNGHDTYGGGRFVYAPLPKDGSTIIDFNKAFNPYCSLSKYVYCPIPPAENRLDYRLAAGEQFHGHEN